jgi:hypothetical protein
MPSALLLRECVIAKGAESNKNSQQRDNDGCVFGYGHFKFS